MRHTKEAGSLTTTSRASDVETVDGDIEIFFVRRLLSGIELSSFVDVLAARHTCLTVSCSAGGTWWGKEGRKEARRTFHGKGGHEANGHYFWAGIFGNAGSGDFRRVEVRGIVFLQDFAFRHGGRLVMGLRSERTFDGWWLVIVCSGWILHRSRDGGQDGKLNSVYKE